MKKHIMTLLAGSMLLCGTSCNYLDISPELGIDEQDVFSSYKNYLSFFRTTYYGTQSDYNLNIRLGFPLYIDGNNMRFAFYTLTDAADCGRFIRPQSIKRGNLGLGTTEFLTTTVSRRPISTAMFKVIRVANISIENIGMLQNASDIEKWDILGQAYFLRSYAHFTLVRYFGGMPYLDKALDEDDEWDMARLTPHETLLRCAEDLDIAYDYLKRAGKMRRDAPPGEPGHLSSTEMLFPNAVAAKAMKGRVLLYAASPLNNRNGRQDWIDAAEACGEALQLALDQQYELIPQGDWTKNYWGTAYTNEEIWAFNLGSLKAESGYFAGLLCYPQSGFNLGGGTCPTQNFVDKFETANGYPLNTEQDRNTAVSLGYYNEQNPYNNRDPRLDATIIYDGSRTSAAPTGINIYYDPATATYPTTTLSSRTVNFGYPWGGGSSDSYSNTGYYLRKWWNGAYGTSAAHQHTDPLLRMAELYLNYAEAVNEAHGPKSSSASQSLTAEEAVNAVRSRFGMPGVRAEYLSDADAFRERIHNERNVELAFEGHHYYHDIRRWKTAPQTMTQTLTGMYVEKTAVSSTYPNGRKYERRAIPANRQGAWKSAMYYIPFTPDEANKMQHFVNNEIW